MEIADFRGELLLNEPMSKHTSFGIGGPADVLACPVDRDDLKTLLLAVSSGKGRWFFLGGGTNLLVKDGGFRGVVISLRAMKKIAIEREYRSIGGFFSVVYTEAGAPMSKLLSFAAEEGLTGVEFAAGIPGTVGGAICMNAGTAHGEMGDVVESVTLVSSDGKLIARTADEMGFGYRTSVVPEGHAVLEARLVLRRGDQAKIKSRIKKLIETRKQRQPLGFRSAGSVFKNPLEESAGKLIETAGLKGTRVGDAQVSDRHANFIVNLGKAKAAQVVALMELVQQTVLEVHGVRLEPELKIIGED